MLRRIKLLSFADGGFFALMVGFGETLAITYLASMKMSGVQLGLLTTLPPALGAVFQALSPYLFRGLSTVRVTLLAVMIQIIGLLGVGFVLAQPQMHFLLMGLFLTLYWMGGMTGGSPWQEWLARLIPQKEHNRFFSARSAFMSLVMLTSYLIVGFFLNQRLNQDIVSTLVFVSVGFRILSMIALAMHPAPPESSVDLPNETALAEDALNLKNLSSRASSHTFSLAALCLLVF